MLRTTKTDEREQRRYTKMGNYTFSHTGRFIIIKISVLPNRSTDSTQSQLKFQVFCGEWQGDSEVYMERQRNSGYNFEKEE